MAKKELYRLGLAAALATVAGLGMYGCQKSDSNPASSSATPDLAIKVGYYGLNFHGEVSPHDADIPAGSIRFTMLAIVDGDSENPILLYDGVGVHNKTSGRINPENLEPELLEALIYLNTSETYEHLPNVKKIKVKYTISRVDPEKPGEYIEDSNKKNNSETRSIDPNELHLWLDMGTKELKRRRDK